MLRNQKRTAGSGIIWAMAAAGFLVLIVGAALAISYGYHRRSIRNDDTRQAYLTARSGADLVVNEFITGSSTALEIYEYLQKNTIWEVPEVGFSEDMGECSLRVQLREPEDAATTKRTIVVTAAAERNGRSRTVTAVLIGVIKRVGEGGNSDDWDSETQKPTERSLTWYLSSYVDGEVSP